MRALVQRVSRAAVDVEDERVAEIGPGLLVLLGITHEDTEADADRLAAKVRALRGAAEIVKNHHERPDGLGYPCGLRGDDIPLGSRIVMVADAFDAMTSDRPYRRAFPAERAVAELRKHAGTQFDERVVAALDSLIQAGKFKVLHDGNASEEALDLPPARRGA